MNIDDAVKGYVFTTKIELDDDGNFITLRELNMSELMEVKNVAGNEDTKTLAKLEQFLPSCIVESSFTNADGSNATGKQVADMLKKSGSLLSEVLTKWLQSIPFQSRLKTDKK